MVEAPVYEWPAIDLEAEDRLVAPVKAALLRKNRQEAEDKLFMMLYSHESMQEWQSYVRPALHSKVPNLLGFIRRAHFSLKVATASINVKTGLVFINPAFFLKYVKSYGNLLELLFHERDHHIIEAIYGCPLIEWEDWEERGVADDCYINAHVRAIVRPPQLLTDVFYLDGETPTKPDDSRVILQTQHWQLWSGWKAEGWSRAQQDALAIMYSHLNALEGGRFPNYEDFLQAWVSVFKFSTQKVGVILVRKPSAEQLEQIALAKEAKRRKERLAKIKEEIKGAMMRGLDIPEELEEELEDLLGRKKVKPKEQQVSSTEELSEADVDQSAPTADGLAALKEILGPDIDVVFTDDEESGGEDGEPDELEDFHTALYSEAASDGESDEQAKPLTLEEKQARLDARIFELRQLLINKGLDPDEGRTRQAPEGWKDPTDAIEDSDEDRDIIALKQNAGDNVDLSGFEIGSTHLRQVNQAFREEDALDGHFAEIARLELLAGIIYPWDAMDLISRVMPDGWNEPDASPVAETPNVGPSIERSTWYSRDDDSPTKEVEYEDGTVYSIRGVKPPKLKDTDFLTSLATTIGDKEDVKSNFSTATQFKARMDLLISDLVGDILSTHNILQRYEGVTTVPTLDRKSLLFLALGVIPPWYRQTLDLQRPPVWLYVDVSGSMTEYYVLIPHLVKHLQGHCDRVLHASMVVVDADVEDEYLFGDGGTDYTAWCRHMLRFGVEEAIVLTDNTDSIRLPDKELKRLKEQLKSLYLISTRKGYEDYKYGGATDFKTIATSEVKLYEAKEQQISQPLLQAIGTNT